MASGTFDGAERQKQLAILLARIVAAEMEFIAKSSNSDEAHT
jgi:hypothetical protein